MSIKAAPNSVTVTLPYTPYSVPMAGRNSRLDMTPNARNRRRFPDTGARDQMRSDAFYLTRHAMSHGWTASGSVTIDITCRTKVRRNRDRDNLLSGLKWGLDGIAQALGVDDSIFQFGTVTFEKGPIEKTEIVISRNLPVPP
jgi:hypothetical protein